MSKRTVLTGITTTGTPHLGNYVGAIKPCIEASRDSNVDSYYFLADYHALVKSREPDRQMQSTLEIAASWLALGLDTETACFYRQSDIPEIPELTWILTCFTAKGLMNRAHAYKAAVQENLDAGEDADFAINMGLFSYPILMSADILMFKANEVPVGKDQVQHLEMARDIAQRFNHHYGEHFVIPSAVTDDNVAVLPGQDGRKMSKSYNNTIPLWLEEKKIAQGHHADRHQFTGTGRSQRSGRFRALCHLRGLRKRFATSRNETGFRRRHRLGRGETANL